MLSVGGRPGDSRRLSGNPRGRPAPRTSGDNLGRARFTPACDRFTPVGVAGGAGRPGEKVT
ncbi:hypothetical protein [Frankia sp. R82]|uniref:hypothetical protein n=1 Tax=Frankia sp. R82 TaxID=2950553 RepID=UPI0020430181|nr:hypothetical protein [Frankia sp. R82]MCM3882651.1 hypothetical protein [Frankia sp. R82]